MSNNEPSTQADDLPTYDFTVEWGDGTSSEFKDYDTTPDAWWHTYEKPGVYTVSINGIFRQLYCAQGWNGALLVDGQQFYDKDGYALTIQNNRFMHNYLSKVIAWGNTRLVYAGYGCYNCSQLTSIPMYDTTNSFEDVIDISSMFRSCFALTSIPFDTNTNRGLFSNCPKLKYASYLFGDARGITGELPQLLLNNCPKLESIEGIFSAAYGLKGTISSTFFSGNPLLDNIQFAFNSTKISGEIPENLFDDCINITNAKGVFRRTNITGTIPGGLFKNCSKLKSLNAMFSECNNIIGVDGDVFSGLTCSSITMDYMFYNCTGLTFIGDNIFNNFTPSQQVIATNVFAMCNNLKDIPNTIWNNISNLFDARQLFAMCSGITSNIEECPYIASTHDEYWKYHNIFTRCTSIPSYNTIPTDFGGRGARINSKYKEGMVVLSDNTFTEIKDFLYNDNNKPIGIVVHSDDNNTHYIMALNQLYTYFVAQKDLDKLPSTWNEVPNKGQSKELTFYGEYNGEEYTNAFREWSGYTNSPTTFDLMYKVQTYKSGNENHIWYIPNPTELKSAECWDIAINDLILSNIENGGSVNDLSSATIYGFHDYLRNYFNFPMFIPTSTQRLYQHIPMNQNISGGNAIFTQQCCRPFLKITLD